MTEVQKELLLELKEAVNNGNVDLVEKLLESDAGLIHQTIAPLGPWLQMATLLATSDMLHKLLRMGADPNEKRRSSSENALASAARIGNLEMVRLLHEAGAIMDTSKTTASPLFAAVNGRNVKVAQYLLDQGIDSTIKYKTRRELEISALDFA